MKPWEAQIPRPPKNKEVKRLYYFYLDHFEEGQVGFLSDKQITFLELKYPNLYIEEILEKDTIDRYSRKKLDPLKF